MEPKGTGMKLDWQKDPKSMNRYVAESPRFRFVMVDPLRGKPILMVQHASDDWKAKPIDQRVCLSRRNAERVAQRFENSKDARRLR
jgi:hypothetical protein